MRSALSLLSGLPECVRLQGSSDGVARVWHTIGTLGAKMEVLEAGASREVLCYQEVSGATRRDRTGDLLITNRKRTKNQ